MSNDNMEYNIIAQPDIALSSHIIGFADSLVLRYRQYIYSLIVEPFWIIERYGLTDLGDTPCAIHEAHYFEPDSVNLTVMVIGSQIGSRQTRSSGYPQIA